MLATTASRCAPTARCASPRRARDTRMNRRATTRRHASGEEGERGRSDEDLYAELEKINAANNSKSASDWISSWSNKMSNPPDEEALRAEAEAARLAEEARLEELRCYRYVYVHDLLSGVNDSFARMYLSDALGTVQIELEAPDLVDGDANFTISSALEKLTAAVEAGDKSRPLRLIGASTGALVAALYAEKNRGRAEKIFLLAPTWGLEQLLDKFEAKYGVLFTEAFRADAATHPEFPTVTCPAYVIHGHDDDISPVDNSARWMQMASQFMRQDGDSEENVAERRLLEVNGLGHGVETALPMSMGRFTEFFSLPRVDLNLREQDP